MNTKLMVTKFGKMFPKKYAKMNHDYVGLMTGKLPDEIHKVLLCLDCDEILFPTIEKEKPDIVISHHPFIYGTKGYVLKHDPYRRALVEKLAKINVPVYSLHTNFDTGKGGMNDALANALGLKNITIPENIIMMRVGELEKPMDINEVAKLAVKSFNVDYSLLVNGGPKKIKKIGIIGGGGSRQWTMAQDLGCDLYISGDAPHYVRRDIMNRKFNYLDMPHEIEKIFIPTMKKILLELDPSLDIVCIDHEKLPLVIE